MRQHTVQAMIRTRKYADYEIQAHGSFRFGEWRAYGSIQNYYEFM